MTIRGKKRLGEINSAKWPAKLTIKVTSCLRPTLHYTEFRLMPRHIKDYRMSWNSRVSFKKNKTTNAKSMPKSKKSIVIYG